MRKQPLHSLGFALALTLVTGCPSSDDGGTEEVGDTAGDTTAGTGTDEATTTATDDATTTADTTDTADTTETTDTGEPVCPTHDPGAGLPDGDPCLANSECASHVCALLQDAPPLEATCEPTPAGCATRFTGRLIDFSTGDTVEGIDLKVAAALQAALMPGTATALAGGTSGADGTFDFVSDSQVSAPLGLVGLSSGDGYFLTATGMAAPDDGNFYPAANSIHDVWAVPAGVLAGFSTMLEMDPEFANALPLGEAGGVVGLVRSASTGLPIANATVVSTEADTSGAVVRYLSETGDSFVDTGTAASNGVFVLVKPGLGEVFGVSVDGVPVDGETGTAGSANGAIFTLIFNVPG